MAAAASLSVLRRLEAGLLMRMVAGSAHVDVEEAREMVALPAGLNDVPRAEVVEGGVEAGVLQGVHIRTIHAG